MHVSNKEAEYKYTGQRSSTCENFRKPSLGTVLMELALEGINFPSDGSEGHNTLEELTISTDRDAKVKQVCGKKELNF